VEESKALMAAGQVWRRKHETLAAGGLSDVMLRK